MHPILFEAGSVTVYTYGFFIALGAVLGGLYMWRQGGKQFGLTFDQANTLFVLLIIAGVVGGKLFILFEQPSYYLKNLGMLLSGSGFVFYGSLLTAIPVMLWYFKKNKIPTLAMLDVMAVVTCVVHGFGRIGCFNAGCCYGVPTDSMFGVVFSNLACQARPLHIALHPTQLYEATLILGILTFLLIYKSRKKFDGQLFILYLIIYASGRSVLEMFRGDLERGFVIQDWLSNSQFISILVIGSSIYFYVKLNRRATLIHRRK
ncbi:MAG: prolipoprotein diacylglyceryl transferase [Cyclobacteriaceae bacterium]|nr:prolipoprotein diacylglyceryl transferase [Cyclobacteriaceae bacterium]